MESITIDFLEPVADGLRRLTMTSFPGVCLVLSRNRLDSSLKTELAKPGVYILVGTSNVHKAENGRTRAFELYIGKSDNLNDRIEQHDHDRLKEVWSTAFLFYRDGASALGLQR